MKWYPTSLARGVAVACFLALGVQSAHAQELGEVLNDVGGIYAEAYLQPLADALGADMNAGLFHTARVGGGLLPVIDLYVGAKVMGTLLSDSDKSFDLSYETEQRFRASDGRRYTVPVTFTITDGPTVFGDTSPGVAQVQVNETINPGPDGQNGTSDDVIIDTTATFDVLPGLIDTPIAPFIVPQMRIGSIAGTSVVIRYLPRVGSDDLGTVGFRGLGIRHSISQYLPLFPASLTAQVMWQELTIEDEADDEIFKGSALAGSVAISKSLLIMTVYAGLQVERSSVDVDYTFVPEDPELSSQTVSFELDGDSKFRALGGFAVGLGPFVVNADAAVGNRTVLSAGVGLSL